MSHSHFQVELCEGGEVSVEWFSCSSFVFRLRAVYLRQEIRFGCLYVVGIWMVLCNKVAGKNCIVIFGNSQQITVSMKKIVKKISYIY